MTEAHDRSQFTVWLSLGSNRNPGDHIPTCLDELEQFGKIHAVSSVYITEPVDMEPGAPPVHNLCVKLETAHGPDRLKEELRALENSHGRTRRRDETEAYQARPLDVDILIYEPAPRGFEPHEQVFDEAFVVYPLSELYAPEKLDDLPDDPETWRQSTDQEIILKTVPIKQYGSD